MKIYYVGKQLLGIKLIKYNTKANLLSVSSFGTGKPTCSFDSFETRILMAPTIRWPRIFVKDVAGRGCRVFLSFEEYFCLLNAVVVINN